MKKVTMQQIADQVGVSKFAVSQALSGKPGVSEDTRAKIIQTATALGYYSQPHTRSKRPALQGSEADTKLSAATNTVIILIPNVRFQSRDSLYWGRIIDGVSIALEQRGIGVMMVTESNSEGFMKIINPSGVLGLIGIGYISNQLLLEIRNSAIPFVLIDHEDPFIVSDTIFMSNFDCMRKLISNLVYFGHRNMRFVGNPKYSRSFHDRWWAFRVSLEELGQPVPDVCHDPLLTIGDKDEYLVIDKTVRELISSNRLPSVFVCANDFFAHIVLRTLISEGVKVPAEVSVTGFDDLQDVDGDLPGLTTVYVPNELMGKRAVEVLFKRLQEPELPYEKTLIIGDVLMRQSVKR